MKLPFSSRGMTSVVTRSTLTRNVGCGWSDGGVGEGVPACAHSPAVSATSQAVDHKPPVFNFIGLDYTAFSWCPAPGRQDRRQVELQAAEVRRGPRVFGPLGDAADGAGLDSARRFDRQLPSRTP